MAAPSAFDRSVFVNCPFDDEFQPILQAILFCILDCDLTPRIATERQDSGEVRLFKIVELIRECRYSIHDLSRVQSAAANEYARLNMPFELGIDLGIRLASDVEAFSHKRLLVIAKDPYKHQQAISDIAGWDIYPHGDDFRRAIKEVRGWLATLHLATLSSSQVIGHYVNFQEWDYERLLADSWSDDDIRERKTPELLDAMEQWVSAGRPATFP